jgi:hypothetical protein
VVDVAYTLVDTAGVSHVFGSGDAAGIGVAPGAKGLGVPAFAINVDKLPYAPGGRTRRISTPPAMVDIPLTMQAASAAALEALLDNLAGWVLPGTENVATPKTVRFQVLATDGTVREIEGICTGGFDDDDSLNAFGVNWQDTILSLLVPDPYWSDTTDTVVTFSSTPPASASWFPYYPYNLAPTSVFSTQDITLGGQIEAWPVWTITGPCSQPALRNLTTGDVFALDTGIAIGDTITVDTRPLHKSVRRADGTNLWPQVVAGSVMWPLDVGLNSVRVELSTTTLATSASLTYRRRWARARRR